MCGLAGFLGGKGMAVRDRPQVLRQMADALRHRGPDGDGYWIDGDADVGLAHRRLAVLDVTDAGQQPMTSQDGRWMITFNGEIYNFKDLRAELEARAGGGPRWRSRSDTEVLLEMIAARGVKKTLPKLDGMFSFAVWDRANRRLTLARDPFGEKPMYYGRVGTVLVFASELTALQRFPGFDLPIDPKALASYLRYGYVPSPLSIFKDIRKLLPGCAITFDGADPFDSGRVWRFWDPLATAAASLSDPFSGEEEDAIEELETHLKLAVRRRMVSDVPIGVLLSGGIDSSLITALMQTQSSRPVQTFSIGSTVADYDEAPHAKRVAEMLGTDHHEMRISPSVALKLAPAMPGVYDEPFGDSSQIPVFMVSEFARRTVTVALSGDGGDELFGGYNRHTYAPYLWTFMCRIPLPVRQLISTNTRALGPEAWNRLTLVAPWLFPKMLQVGRAGEKLHKFAAVCALPNESAYHEALLSLIPSSRNVSQSLSAPLSLTAQFRPPIEAATFAERAMLLDTVSYLPDDILVKTDRASMAHSLELRAPFLDRRVFTLAWRFPLAFKVKGRIGKSPLRQVLYRYVPKQIVDRPKHGFAVPVGRWLRAELRDWAEGLLAPNRLKATGFLDPSAVRTLWDEHQSGQHNREASLWVLLMLLGWLDQQPASAA